jgi:hypothetical protein
MPRKSSKRTDRRDVSTPEGLHSLLDEAEESLKTAGPKEREQLEKRIARLRKSIDRVVAGRTSAVRTDDDA